MLTLVSDTVTSVWPVHRQLPCWTLYAIFLYQITPKLLSVLLQRPLKRFRRGLKFSHTFSYQASLFFRLLFLLKAGKHCTKNSKEAGKLGQVRKEGMSTIVWECPSCLSNLKRLAWLDFCDGICLGIHHGDKLFKMRDIKWVQEET